MSIILHVSNFEYTIKGVSYYSYLKTTRAIAIMMSTNPTSHAGRRKESW